MREFELENQIDPQKRLYFYLSYAQAEEKSEVQQFFKELSDSIRVRAGLPLTEVVGCGNELNANDREEGLRTSRLMIALLSPAYFKDKTTAREWQVFEMRKAKSDSIDTNVIIPIPWHPYSGPVPRVISRTPIFSQNGVDRDEPVGILLRSRGKHREYAAFVNSLANYIVDSTASSPSGKAANERYLVFAIDDEPEDMKKIVTTAGFSLDFDLKGYENCNQLLNDVSSLLEDRQEPDLVVLNPELIVAGTHRFKLIDALLEKKVPSAILAISKDPDAGSSLRSAGIKDLVAVLQKPFTSVDLLQRMRHWARIGRDKRYRRGRSDERPVFLSYSSQNAAMASKLCNWLELREIGVWYTAEFLEAGDPWRDKVSDGLAQAKVFIPLISDNYPRSPYCQGELGNILDRLQRAADDLRVIPVLYNPSATTLEDQQIKTCLNQHAVEISDRDWLPGFRQILLSIQKFLRRRQNQS